MVVSPPVALLFSHGGGRPVTAEAAQAFAERIQTDQAFVDQLTAVEDRDEKLAVVRAAGYDMSPDDFPAFKDALGVSEISDEDLEKVAGGGSDTAMWVVVGVNGGV